jgi:hypothetical protein
MVERSSASYISCFEIADGVRIFDMAQGNMTPPSNARWAVGRGEVEVCCGSMVPNPAHLQHYTEYTARICSSCELWQENVVLYSVLYRYGTGIPTLNTLPIVYLYRLLVQV